MRRFVSLLLAMLLIISFSACKTQRQTTLDSVDVFYCDGCKIEATARELTVDGGTTSARIRFANMGSDPLGYIDALVEFVDAAGDTIASDVIHILFEAPLEVGDGVSATAICDSDARITGVYVSLYEP